MRDMNVSGATNVFAGYQSTVNNPVSMSPLSGDRKPQIRF